MEDRRDARSQAGGRKRCLLTGFSKAQCTGEVPLGVWAFSPQLRRALEQDGWEVHQREPRLDDDPALWDLVLVGITPLLGFSGRHQYAALQLLNRAWDWGNAATFVDDWQLRSIPSNLRTIMKDPTYLAGRQDRGRKDYEWALAHRNGLLEVCERLLTNEWPRMIWPRHNIPSGVSPHLLLKGNKDDEVMWGGSTWVDPTCTVTKPAGLVLTPPSARQRAWVWAALTKAGEGWGGRVARDSSWPVLRAGKTDWDLGKVPEQDLVRLHYTANWGVLSTPYPHVGSGWFRVRFIFAAMARAVLLCDPREMPLPAYGHPLSLIESWDTAGLRDLADDQADSLRAVSWTWMQFAEAVNRAVR